MSNMHMVLTVKGQMLNAKIQAGNGKVPLEITRIVSAAGYSDDPLNLDSVIDMRQTAKIVRKEQYGLRAVIEITLSNQGNPTTGEPPLTQGYTLTQFGMYAIDPDEGEILYRISQFSESPQGVPAAFEMGWTINPTWNIVTGNASEVIVNIDPSGMATVGQLETHIDALVSSEKGVHGIRFYDGRLQVWGGEDHGWMTIETKPRPPEGEFSISNGVLSNTAPFGTLVPNGTANTLVIDPGFANASGQTVNLIS